jgi:hypothetical protein
VAAALVAALVLLAPAAPAPASTAARVADASYLAEGPGGLAVAVVVHDGRLHAYACDGTRRRVYFTARARRGRRRLDCLLNEREQDVGRDARISSRVGGSGDRSETLPLRATRVRLLVCVAGHSITVLAIAGGSRPASSQPAAVAASGTPMTASAR